MKRKRIFYSIAFFAIFAIVCLFFLRFVYPDVQMIITPDFGQSDATTSLATKFLLGNSLHHFTIPFWSSKIGGGYPVYANGGMGVWYIPNLIVFSLFSPPFAFVASLFSSTLLLGWGMYVWMRCIGISSIPSLFGAITTALCGYVIVQFTHITIVQSLSIFPWCLIFCHLIIENPKRIYVPMLAFVYSQLIFIGFAQSIFITSLFMLSYVIWVSYKRKVLVRSIIHIAFSIMLGVFLSAVHLLPAIEFLSQLNRNGSFSSDTATLFSYPIRHLLTLLNPFALGNPATGTYPHFFAFNGSVFWENTAYIGILPILLCTYFIGSIVFRKKINIHTGGKTIFLQFFGGLAIVSFLLMLGRNSPFYFIFTFYPFNLFRVPSRFIWLFIISLIMISTIMLEEILKKITVVRTRSLIGVFLILIQILTVFYLFSGYHNLEPAHEWLKPPSLTQYLRPGFTLTIGGEIAFNSAYFEHGWDIDDASVRPSYILRNTFTPDKNSLWDVSQIRDYSGREFKRTKIMNDLLTQTITTSGGNATISASGEKLLSLYGISNIISTLKLSHTTLLQIAVLSDPKTQITLFHNSQSLPKAYIATESARVHTIKEAVAALLSDSFVIGQTALVDRDLHASISGAPSNLQIVSQKEGKYEYTLTPVQHETLIVTTENYYPGWTAYADGIKIKPIAVNVSQIGILVPKNTTKVTLEFIPTDFKVGAAISILTLIILVFGVVFLLSV